MTAHSEMTPQQRLTSATVAAAWTLVVALAGLDFAAANRWTDSPTPAGIRSLAVGAAITVSVVHAINTAIRQVTRSQARITLDVLAMRAEQAELVLLGEKVREMREAHERAAASHPRPGFRWNGKEWVSVQPEANGHTHSLGKTS